MEILMNKKLLTPLSCLILGASVLLCACGEKQEAPPPKAAVDQLAPRYESTLAEGIVFNKPGYPSFLVDVVGVSNVDPWGRWTDGPTVKFRFNKPLPKKFGIELYANAFGPNEGKPITIRAGNVERAITIKNDPNYAINIATFDDVASDTIEIIPPNPISPKELDPKSGDIRKLGLGLVSLKIRTVE